MDKTHLHIANNLSEPLVFLLQVARTIVLRTNRHSCNGYNTGRTKINNIKQVWYSFNSMKDINTKKTLTQNSDDNKLKCGKYVHMKMGKVKRKIL